MRNQDVQDYGESLIFRIQQENRWNGGFFVPKILLRIRLNNSIMGRMRRPVFLILVILSGLNIFAWSIVHDASNSDSLEVIFFDVGQGDAIFIQTPHQGLGGGHQILIDGGPDSAVLEKLGREMPFWDRTIDLIVLTHPEHDHIAGLLEVLKRYEVKNILWTGVVRDTAEFREWEKLTAEEEAEIIIAKSLLRIDLNNSSFSNSYIDVLYPFEDLSGQEIKRANNTSVVAKLVCGEKSFLLTGDIEKSVEKELLESGADIDSDVLKVAHHGSKTSSAEEFVEKVSPEIAVISAGKNNSYGHPHAETLATLSKYGINVLRTDELGDVKILCGSRSLKLK